MAAPDLNRLRAWTSVPAPVFVGGNQVDLLQGGDELFPCMCAAIDAALHEVWLATYIFHDDTAAQAVASALHRAAARGVAVHVLVDGFGSIKTLAHVRQLFDGTGVQLEVFRPLDRWYAWLQPGQLRRLHQKLCVCDKAVAFVGGINVIDDRHDMNHGWQDTPRLDFAVAVRGPLVLAVQATARAMWARAHMVRNWRSEFQQLVQGRRRMARARGMLSALRGAVSSVPEMAPPPMRAAFLVRDNLRQRRSIERSYVAAIRHARTRVDIAVPYFYPGRGFMRALRHAARRGVRVRLLLQGKIDYRIAALAAQALYDELRFSGVRIFEYTPAFLHAKVALADDDWATVGSSNIDPLSLLLNLEANVVVRDAQFTQALAMRFEAAFAASTEVSANTRTGLRGWLRRALVAWSASIYLRLAGITGRY
ncbi:MAG: cardiolipin synthase ClsB [Rubrivivax sp.]|jgi:cardiolipin synthase|nr:cardiolipin synthase ClsB [Rubrivivax sp.]